MKPIEPTPAAAILKASLAGMLFGSKRPAAARPR